MTDAYLMEADCIHGTTWYECKTCEKEMAEDLTKLEAKENEIPDIGVIDKEQQ